MTISAMGKKCVVLCLAMCLVVSSFHEVSCQVDGIRDVISLDDQEFDDQNFPSNVKSDFKEGEISQSSKKKSEEKISWEQSSELIEEETSSVDVDNSAESEDLSGYAEGSGLMDKAEREMEAGSATTYAEQIERIKKKSMVETREAKLEVSEESESADDKSGTLINQIYYGSTAEKESASSRTHYESTKSNGGSGIMGSLGLRQSVGWRCINQDKNGGKDEDDAAIVIPKYDMDEIIKEESLSQMTNDDGIRVRDLVDRSDFEEILAIASQYEEVSLAKVSHISKLSMYKSIIIEGKKASIEAKLAQNRIGMYKRIVMEKKKNVDAEFASLQALAKRGDMLSVKIFAIKKLLLKLEAEKEEVDMDFNKATVKLSRVLEEVSKAEDDYHFAMRKWKQEKSYAEHSEESIQKAEFVWVQFLDTLEATD